MARVSDLRRLDYGDIQWKEDGKLQVTLRFSKTDQEGRGRTVVIPHVDDPLVDPATVLQRYVDKAHIAGGPLFCSVSRTDQPTSKRLSAAGFEKRIKESAARMGLPNASQYTVHSLRRGSATTAARKNISTRSIKRHGGWESDAVEGYVDEAADASEAVVEALF
eukprot:gnl/Trimastix_PCT/1999.p2 GENE.gnl/Trimastix_PCT/1999~~gnl/Trimastix_PCT/1999.p2  ORF type:complete len:164 (+),score=26.39 gnl/Trimastix_PCT/1999:681-1172(+)